MDENSGLLHWIFRSSRSEVFCKRGVFNNYANFTGKDLCGSVLFNKAAGRRPATLFKKRLRYGCFPVNFARFRTPPVLCWLCSKSTVRTSEWLHLIMLWYFYCGVISGDTLTKYFVLLNISKQLLNKFQVTIYMSFWWAMSSFKMTSSTLIKYSYIELWTGISLAEIFRQKNCKGLLTTTVRSYEVL